MARDLLDNPIAFAAWMTLVIVVVIVCLPILVPVGVTWACIGHWRRVRVAKRTPCEVCGTMLGKAAMRLADEARRDRYHALRDKYPAGRLMQRVAHPPLDAICPDCATSYFFSKGSYTRCAGTDDELSHSSPLPS